jgi:hypothetical protein
MAHVREKQQRLPHSGERQALRSDRGDAPVITLVRLDIAIKTRFDLAGTVC